MDTYKVKEFLFYSAFHFQPDLIYQLSNRLETKLLLKPKLGSM